MDKKNKITSATQTFQKSFLFCRKLANGSQAVLQMESPEKFRGKMSGGTADDCWQQLEKNHKPEAAFYKRSQAKNNIKYIKKYINIKKCIEFHELILVKSAIFPSM